MKRHYIYILLAISFCWACSTEKKTAENQSFTLTHASKAETNGYDLSEIQQSGELIVATLSGPDTYYDYHGQPMGLQYALAADFARQEGLRIRVETDRDSSELWNLLANGEADIIAYPLSEKEIVRAGFRATGIRNIKTKTAWAVRTTATELADALDRWQTEGAEVPIRQAEKQRYQERRTIRRKIHAPYVSKEKGIISIYDNDFRKAAAITGWDWRLIAAQCYQESGFDPNAISWAGARGLMQLMPSTAQHLGLSADHMYSPSDNIAAAARYIRELNDQFRDIRSEEERIKFVLASYNGGIGHIRDAMALAKKYGKRPDSWEDVSVYVSLLSQPRYYRDPIVRHGYMIGSETTGYVISVLERWRTYGGRCGLSGTNVGSASSPMRSTKRNRFTGDRKIYKPDDPEFSGKKKESEI